MFYVFPEDEEKMAEANSMEWSKDHGNNKKETQSCLGSAPHHSWPRRFPHVQKEAFGLGSRRHYGSTACQQLLLVGTLQKGFVLK